MGNTNETNSIPKPQLREKLPVNPVKYLRETYPTRINGAGIKMSDNIDYITEERTFMNRTEVKDCISNKGLDSLGLLWFLRLMMADNLGWGIDVTDKEYAKICNILAIDLGVTKNKIEKMVEKLINSKILIVINEDGRTYWTTLQQYYNYEYKSWYKVRNNIASKKYYESKKAQTEDNKETESIMNSVEQLPTNADMSIPVPEGFLGDADENEIF